MRTACLLLLLGCRTPMVWQKDGADRQDFLSDKYACTQESRTSWAGGGSGFAGVIARRRAQSQAEEQATDLYNMCMEARGWRLIEKR